VDLAAVGISAVDDKCEHPYLIDSVRLLSANGKDIVEVATGMDLMLEMKYRALTNHPHERISFVFNIYRHDGLYVCGTTTLMDGIPPFPGGQCGRVTVHFPSFPLLSGQYKFRAAINDHGGFVVLAEAKDVCNFSVVDSFNAVGLVNLHREWHVETN
jgi:lipopolysaccharide transport system ATP-binding protein